MADDQYLDVEKINTEMAASQPTPRMEDTAPIAIPETNEFEKADKEQKIVDCINQYFTDWESARQPRETLWQNIYRMYMTVIEKTKTLSRSNLTLPIIYQVIESAVPKVMNTLFASGDSFFDVEPILQNNDGDTEKAPKIKKLLEVQLAKASFFIKFMDFVKQLMLYGTSYLFVYWKVKREWVWERVPVRKEKTILGIPLGEEVEWQETKSYKVVERRPEVEVLDILDVYPDPDAENEDEGRGVIIRSWIDIDDLREMGKGKYPIFANTEHPDLQGGDKTFAESRSERNSARGVSSDTKKKNGKSVELLKFWGKYDVDGDGIKEEAEIVVANRKVLLKAKANPFHHQKRPLIRSVLFPVPKEWYGIGLVEPVISQVHELNTLRRQRIDNINLVINRMWQVNSLADVDLDTLISAPNNIVITDQMDAVKPLDTQDVTGGAYNEATIVQQDIERATVPPSAQGSPTTGQLGRTARGAQLIIGQALEKFGTATKLIEEQALKKVLNMFHWLNLQFVDDDQVLQDETLYAEITDLQMTPEDLRAKTHFKMLGISEMVGSEGKINQIVSYMGVFGKVLSPNSISTLAQKVWTLMGFNKNEIMLAGMQLQPGVENVVDPNVSAAIVGQAGNQGTSAAPPTAPGIGL